jgi:hypothetical protein
MRLKSAGPESAFIAAGKVNDESPLPRTLARRQDAPRIRRRDANGQALVYIYSRDSEAEALQAKVLTKDEARRIAVNVARLPELLGKGERET